MGEYPTSRFRHLPYQSEREAKHPLTCRSPPFTNSALAGKRFQLLIGAYSYRRTSCRRTLYGYRGVVRLTCSGMLFTGRLADILGRKKLYLSGMALFVVSSVVTGVLRASRMSCTYPSISVWQNYRTEGLKLYMADAKAPRGNVCPARARGPRHGHCKPRRIRHHWRIHPA